MVRVVRREREQAVPVLERLVPVERRVAAPDLELAARVPHLDPDEPLAGLPLVGAQTAPVRVREVGDAAVLVNLSGRGDKDLDIVGGAE